MKHCCDAPFSRLTPGSTINFYLLNVTVIDFPPLIQTIQQTHDVLQQQVAHAVNGALTCRNLAYRLLYC
ncbi:MAG: hypothetical protein JWQ40_2057 [Segetibacter sp.]|nr:hypothetical protein [Segetibacter sp.]